MTIFIDCLRDDSYSVDCGFGLSNRDNEHVAVQKKRCARGGRIPAEIMRGFIIILSEGTMLRRSSLFRNTVYKVIFFKIRTCTSMQKQENYRKVNQNMTTVFR